MRITFYWAWLHPIFFVKTTHASGKDLKKKKKKTPDCKNISKGIAAIYSISAQDY